MCVYACKSTLNRRYGMIIIIIIIIVVTVIECWPIRRAAPRCVYHYNIDTRHPIIYVYLYTTLLVFCIYIYNNGFWVYYYNINDGN